MLKLNPNVQKCLISTPCYFIGDYITDKIRLDLVFPSMENSYTFKENMSSNPYARNFIVIVLGTDNDNEVDNMNTMIANRISILMAVFYGKCIFQHGFLEANGNYWASDNSNIKPNRYYYIPPFNQLPRKDIGDKTIKTPPPRICLDTFNILNPIIANIDEDSEFNRILYTAGAFYLHSLTSLNTDPEIAYLDLISCGEVLSNYSKFNYDETDVLAPEILEEFNKMELLPNNKINIRLLKGQLRSIKRKYTITLLSLLNRNYFNNDIIDLPNRNFVNNEYLKRITIENAEIAIKSSYDLRSSFLHGGKPFGNYITPFTSQISELRIGEVVIESEDRDYIKTVNNSLLYVGLERLMRYSLLRFIQRFSNIQIHNMLNDD